ncbi:MAG: acetamidase [Spirochaetaceae bacterium]|nr:MAG: acetamidase [Spirochaetaceae bacterium]
MARHTFVPNTYHTTIGQHKPVLHVMPGDSVSTTTVDARGFDQNDKQVADRGNPMTGPFFIDGAEPGDTLVVVFNRIRPNRTRGFTSPRIAPIVLDPGFAVTHADGVDHCDWDVDAASGSARLVEPRAQISRLALPIAPMIGCFGVAPPGGQAISTATSSTHGGNMDYRRFGEGITVYLPVFVPGALFHLGDGHAVQGDGEIVGTGIEISMDVTFTVDLIRGQTISWPRAETDEHLMTVGNARPLDQCVQHATTEMIKWLQNEYALDPLSTHSLLGQAVEYELGNMYDPAYTMVCKLQKSLVDAICADPRG